jgi:hypothetical protein
VKKIIFFFLVFICSYSFAQERLVQGVVFDKDSKIRLARVFILNTQTQSGVYNNSKGEFKLTAQAGDELVAQLEGFRSDTIRVLGTGDFVFYLRRNSIRLQEVVIKDSVKTPSKRLQEVKEEYKDIYRIGNSSDLLHTGGGNGLGGVGLSIDALYSLFSRQGKNARNLQKTIDRDFKDLVIDYRYSPALIQQVIGITGAKAKDFMQQYRPAYSFVLEANDYDMIRFIQESYRRYRQNPGAYRLPPLKN